MRKFLQLHLPPHSTYVEPYAGGASLLMRKRRAEVEVISDLDADLLNLFHVVAGEDTWQEFSRQTQAREYCDQSFLPSPDPDGPIARAVALVAWGAMHRNASRTSGFRGHVPRPNGTTMASDWARYHRSVPGFHRRLRDVVILQRPAIDVMKEYDGEHTVHYCDPPYLPSTRTNAVKHPYAHDMTEAQHVELLDCLTSLEGMVMLSGYDSELYDDRLFGWEKLTAVVGDNAGKKRTECLWLNPAATYANLHKGTRYWPIRHVRHRNFRGGVSKWVKVPDPEDMFA